MEEFFHQGRADTRPRMGVVEQDKNSPVRPREGETRPSSCTRTTEVVYRLLRFCERPMRKHGHTIEKIERIFVG
jgi:hypothetical protein